LKLLERAVGPRIGRIDHRVGESPKDIAPREDLADLHLRRSRINRSGRFTCLENQSGEEVQLHCQPRTAVQREARDKAGERKKTVRLLEVAIDEQVLPRHQHLVHDEDGVVLITRELRG